MTIHGPGPVVISLIALAVTLAACDGGNSSEDASTDTAADSTGDVIEDATDTAVDTDTDTPADGAECTSDEDCDNHTFCDGQETCSASGTCQDGTPPTCDDSDPCTTDSCDDTDDACSNEPVDADGDGAPAAEVDGTECAGGTDCDDDDADAYPGATEGCELADLDCDGEVAEFLDDDEDGWIDSACDDEMTDPGDFSGFGDCDDEDDTIYPGAPEGCDGTIDHDCDGDATDLEADADGDGYAPASCSPPEGEEDCDDSNADAYPGAEEICDMVDNDCDGSWADGGADDDADGFLDELCGGDDCDDTNDIFRPDADIICTSQDRDCNGAPDNDQDGDGALRATAVMGWPVCDPTDDCDDTDASIHPSATPGCTTDDVNCSGTPDNDEDDDGHIRDTCGGDDCNDDDDTIHPDAAITCTTVDMDCNTHPDDDQDGDGHVRIGCTDGDDCNDDDDTIHPDAAIDCSTTDHDCNSKADQDNDGDGYLREECGGDDCDDEAFLTNPGIAPVRCVTLDEDCNGNVDTDNDGDGDDRIACGGSDCNDEDDTIYTGAAEICDTVDQDCDDDILDVADADDDRDGYLDEDCGGDDCDDTSEWFHPPPDAGASVCAAWDFDCSGTYDPLDAVFTGPRDTSTNNRQDVSVAWSGSQWGVVWSESPGAGESQIMLAIFDLDGTVMNPSAIASGPGEVNTQPDIAWSEAAGRWGVIWIHDDGTGARPNYQVFEEVMGSLQSYPSSPAIPPAGWDDIQSPAIASDGTYFGAVWVGVDNATPHSQVDFDFFDPSGTSVGFTQLNATGPVLDSHADIAWNTSAFGVVWSRRYDTVPAYTNVFYDIVTPGPSPGQIDEVALTSMPDDQHAYWPTIAAGKVDCGSGTAYDGFMVVWVHEESGSVHSLHSGSFTLDQGLSPNHSSTHPYLSTSPYAFYPSLAYNGDFFGVVWEDSRAGGLPDVFFRTVDVDGSIRYGEVQITSNTSEQDRAPAIATNMEHFGMFWPHLTTDIWYSYGMCWY